MTDSFIRRTRQIREDEEGERLAPAATRAGDSRGREVQEEPDPYRTAFERDRDRVLHSKAFRRLKHKTQVFINPEGDHFVTRLTHTLQVTQVGRSLAVALGLNEPLVEAICLAHEVGHPPFGHTGEVALSPYVEGEWHHAAQGVRVLRVLEPLNLTWEVLDGVRAHTWKVEPPPATPEGMLCRFADRIAYLVHDMDDAVRAGVIRHEDLPRRIPEAFGSPGSHWIGTMVHAVIDESIRRGQIGMEAETLGVMDELRDFMFRHVYLRPEARQRKRHAVAVIRDLVDHFAAHPDQVPDSYRQPQAGSLAAAIDYVSGMTDRYAQRLHDELVTEPRPLSAVTEFA